MSTFSMDRGFSFPKMIHLVSQMTLSSPTGPGEGEQKEYLLHEHERYRNEGASDSRPACRLSVSVEEASPTAALISRLKEITLLDLRVGERHHGKVLHGRLCAKAFIDGGIICSILEDSCGRAVQLAIYNAVLSTASSQEVEEQFPSGMRLAIKEPLYDSSKDGSVTLQVDSLAHIVFDESSLFEDDCSLPPSSIAAVIEELETIRSEGNQEFARQNWIGAVRKYSKCIYRAIHKTDMSKITSEQFNRVVMLAYSNRAEAKLRLQAYEDALRDAEKALEFDSKHVKSLVRKGKAAHGLGLYEIACEFFKLALEQSPLEQYILENLKVSMTCHEQSLNGKFDLLWNRVSHPADFVGPVEIRRVRYGCGRRGLFATKSVASGTLLFVCNSIASVHKNVNKSHLMRYSECEHTGLSFNIKEMTHDLVVQLISRAMASKRHLAQLYSLSCDDGKQEMDIPSMELFRPESQWIPLQAEKLEIHVGRIRKIMEMNSFGTNYSDINDVVTQVVGGNQPVTVRHQLFILPSFINHSCSPNCWDYCWDESAGVAKVLRPFREIANGEELTITYSRFLYRNRSTRQTSLARWMSKCECERCILEESLEPQISEMSKRMCLLAATARAECCQGRERRVTKQLADLVREVEAFIHSCGEKLDIDCKKGWIRAVFLDAYISKYRLAIDEHDIDSRIEALRLVVYSMISVSATEETCVAAAMLLQEVETRHSRWSRAYQMTMNRVQGIFRAQDTAPEGEEAFQDYVDWMAGNFEFNKFWRLVADY